MSNSEFSLSDYIEQHQQRVNSALTAFLSALNIASPNLREAIDYAALSGGKRIRPILAYASAAAILEDQPESGNSAARSEATDRAACAVELIHCYSLVHDDLPAMDDDDLRRGRPTLHKAFNEAVAILAGDALQGLAYQILSNAAASLDPRTSLRMINLLCRAAGPEGMVAGQAIDFDSVGLTLTVDQLQTMHQLKTGALIASSVQLGALSTSVTPDGSRFEALSRYADCIGLAFQVQDDILDVTSATGTLGKTQGADHLRNKPTYTSLLGLEGAEQKADELAAGAVQALAGFSAAADPLREIAHFIVRRRH